LVVHRGILGDDFCVPGGLMMSSESMRSSNAVVEELVWTEAKLVLLRTELHHLTRQYKKAKRRFDIAVVNAVLLEDLEATYHVLLPLHSMRDTLYRAFRARNGDMSGLWGGVESPVREPFQGPYALKLEVMWFVWEFIALRLLKVVGAVVCVFLSGCFFWSEMSVAPWVRTHTYTHIRAHTHTHTH